MATNNYYKKRYDYDYVGTPDGQVFKSNPSGGALALINPFAEAASPKPSNNMFSNLKDWYSKNIKGQAPKQVYENYSNWMQNTPIGSTIHKWAPWVAGGLQGINAVQGLSQNSDLASQYDDLQGDILRSFESNPLASTYLTTDQMGMINRLKRGYEDIGAFDGVLEGIGSGLGDTLGAAALGLATGNPIAALVNAGGSLINSGIQGHQNAINENIGDLQSLYSALQMAENEYNTERRQRYADRIRGGIL